MIHNSVIKISGKNFGNKQQPNPVTWDNIEDGSADINATIGKWASVGWPTGLMVASTSRQRSVNSLYNAYAKVPGNGNEYAAFRKSNGAATKWFIQYWFYIGNNWIWEDGNIKIMRLWSDESNLRVQAPINNVDVVVENSDIGHGGYGSNCSSGGWTPVITGFQTIDDILHSRCGGEVLPGSVGWHSYKADMKNGKWHCFQWEYKEGTASNGVLRWWVDGKKLFDHNDINTGNANKYPFIVGWYMSNSKDGNGDLYFDDVYIDSTWARVEIGNDSLYNNCDHRETQIPTNWLDNSISVIVNLGSFNPADNIYLFVVDEEGNASSGYALNEDKNLSIPENLKIKK